MFWVGVAVFLLGLLASIAWHELGHLVPAKKFGVLVTQYMIGFGPTLFSRRRGETEYGVKAVPLGGYIRMVGMYPVEAQLSPARAAARATTSAGSVAAAGPAAAAGTAALVPAGTTAPGPRQRGLRGWSRSIAAEAREFSASEIPAGGLNRTFSSLSVGRRVVVMLGGPVANLVLGFVLLGVAYLGVGVPTSTTTIGAVSACLPAAGQECTDQDPAAPAALAGVQEGDVVIAWGETSVESWSQVQEAIRAGGAAPTTVTVERDGEQLTLTITPQLAEREIELADGSTGVAEIAVVGVSPRSVLTPTSVGEFVGDFGSMLGQTTQMVVTLPKQLYSLVLSTFGDGEREPGLIGLVGVGRIAGEAASVDTDFGAAGSALMLLQVLGSLNLALFVFNLIPLLPLDGGHVAGALWEAVRRRVARWRGRPDPGPVDTARMLPLTYVVVVLFIGMFLLLTVADLIDPVSLTG